LSYDSNSQLWNSTRFNVQSNSLDPITFEITYADTSSNEVTDTGFSVPVLDNDNPWINSDGTSAAGTTGDPHNFTVNVDDNIAIAQVFVSMKYQGGRMYNRIPLMEATGGDYFLVKNLDHNLAPLSYNFTVIDTSGNHITSTDKVISMTDNDLPQIFSDMTRLVAKAGEKNFPFKTMASDNIQLRDIKVQYWFSFDATVNERTMTMLSPDIFYFVIDLPSVSGTMYYKYVATDTPTLNVQESAITEVKLLDTTPPEISNILMAEQGYTGDDFTITATITDDIGVTGDKIYYSFGSGTPMFMTGVMSGNTYSYTIPIPDSLSSLFFWIEAMDLQGNKMMTEIFMVHVMDNDLPVIGSDLSDTTATTGDPFKLKIEASDNIGIGKVDASYMYPGGEWETHTMMVMDLTYYLDITMPNDMDGTFSYYFTVYDTSMNMVQTDQVDLEVMDDEPPTAMLLGPVKAYQFETVVFSSMGSSDNVGVTELTWEIMGVSFNGTEVSYTFDEVGIYTIELKVEDGDNPAVFLTHDIEIMDAEDPVIVVDIPAEIGNHLTLVADASASTDNVGIVSYSWLLITPDNTRKTGSDETLEFDLEGILGMVTVHLTISDKMGNKVSSMYEVNVVDLLPPVVMAPEDATDFEGTLLKFSDQGSTDNTGIRTYMWTISFGTLETVRYGKTLSYFFETEGVYNITLTVTDAKNNSASDYFFVTIMAQNLNRDSDEDGMPDWWEQANGLDKDLDDAQRDYDNDLLTNIEEFKLGTNPKNADTDGDGLPDNWEYKYAYQDGLDDLVDGVPRWMAEFKGTDDTDDDGDDNLKEYLDGNRDPTKKDAAEKETDNTLLIIVVAVMILIIILVIVLALIMVLGKVKPINEEFPESQFPHLYKNIETPAPENLQNQ
jgi:hypothetical protein